MVVEISGRGLPLIPFYRIRHWLNYCTSVCKPIASTTTTTYSSGHYSLLRPQHEWFYANKTDHRPVSIHWSYFYRFIFHSENRLHHTSDNIDASSKITTHAYLLHSAQVGYAVILTSGTRYLVTILFLSLHTTGCTNLTWPAQLKWTSIRVWKRKGSLTLEVVMLQYNMRRYAILYSIGVCNYDGRNKTKISTSPNVINYSILSSFLDHTFVFIRTRG